MDLNESQKKNRSTSRVEKLAPIIAECSDRLNKGKKLDIDKILTEHPDIADELRPVLESLCEVQSALGSENTGNIFGDYQVVREIGRGGMGRVFEAWDINLDRRVALKVLPDSLLNKEKSLKRFVQEAKIAGKLHHQNIVPIYELGFRDEKPYFSMEFVEGETLDKILDRLRPDLQNSDESKDIIWQRISSISDLFCLEKCSTTALTDVNDKAPEEPTTEAPSTQTDFHVHEINHKYCLRLADAFASAAEGIHHAHRQKIIHRDLKPSNLILDKSGQLRVLDFGLARIEGMETLTISGQLLGTPLYMSPEQAQRTKIPLDHRTDIYSLGVTLYEMLTWRPPFRGKSHQDTMSQIITRDPPPLRRLNRDIPKDLETITLKCLQKDPKHRYATCEALAQDLRRFVSGNPIEARPLRAWERFSRMACRRKGLVAGISSVILILVISAMFISQHLQITYEANVKRYRDLILRAVPEFYRERPDGTSMATVQAEFRTLSKIRASSGIVLPITAELGSFFEDPIEKAVLDLKEAIKIFPEKPDAYFFLAQAQIALGKKAEAESSLDCALACDHDYFPAKIYRLSLHTKEEDFEDRKLALEKEIRGSPFSEFWIRAQKYIENQKWREASLVFGELLESSSEFHIGNTIQTRLNRGCILLKGGELDGALEDFAVAHALWPELIQPVCYLGIIYCRKGKADEAEKRISEYYQGKKHSDNMTRSFALVFRQAGEFDLSLKWLLKEKESAEREALISRFCVHLKDLNKAVKAARRAIQLDPQCAKGYESLSIALFIKGDIDGALIAVKKNLQLDPNNALALNTFGNILFMQGNLDDSVAKYKSAIKINPNYTIAYSNLSSVFIIKKDFQNSIKVSRDVIRMDRNYAEAYLTLSVALRNQGKIEEALKTCKQAIKLKPGLALAHYHLGVTLLEKNELDQAICSFNRAIQLKPDCAEAYATLGETWIKKKDVDLAINILKKSIQQGLECYEIRNTLGIAFEEKGESEKAFIEFNKAISLNPNRYEAYNGLGITLKKMGNNKEAVTAFNKAISLNPNRYEAYSGLGNTLKHMGLYNEAVVAFNKAILLNPKSYAVYNNLGNTQRLMEKYNEAIAAFNKALTLEPNFAAEAHLNIGEILAVQGNYCGAIAEYKKALDLKPDLNGVDKLLVKVYFFYAKQLFRKKQWDNAIEACQKALNIKPDRFDISLLKADTLYKKGEWNRAIAAYRRAIRLKSDYIPAYFKIVDVMQEKQDYDGGIAELQSIMALFPKNQKAHYCLINVCILQGRFSEALKTAKKMVDLDSRSPEQKINDQALITFCERMVNMTSELPAFLRGDVKPADGKEWGLWAHLCFSKQYYTASVKCWKSALQYPDIAQVWQSRYVGARAAALAASGEGVNGKGERQQWRKQALVWLQENLELFLKILKKKDPREAKMVMIQLMEWRENPEFSIIRDEKKLLELPDPESDIWKKFWEQVDKMIQVSDLIMKSNKTH